MAAALVRAQDPARARPSRPRVASPSQEAAARRRRPSVTGMTQVKPIPEGFGTVTPNLVVADGAAAIDFYERAFGAQVATRLEAGGMLVHAALRIGGAMVDRCATRCPRTAWSRPDAERAGRRRSSRSTWRTRGALHARARRRRGDGDQPGGRRTSTATARAPSRDPFGHRWAVRDTHVGATCPRRRSWSASANAWRAATRRRRDRRDARDRDEDRRDRVQPSSPAGSGRGGRSPARDGRAASARTWSASAAASGANTATSGSSGRSR